MTTAANRQEFRQRIYDDLETKLRQSPWNAGASEAHGMLCGLACRGIQPEAIRAKAYLFLLESDADIDLIEGMYSLVCREFQDQEFVFEPLLPNDDSAINLVAEAISDWCDGLLQGLCFDNSEALISGTREKQEALEDIQQIAQIEVGIDNAEQDAKDLQELVEYLRVATQLVYDEMRQSDAASPLQTTTTIN